MADAAVDRHLLVDEQLVEIFDVFERRAAEGNLLQDVDLALVVAPRRQVELVVFDRCGPGWS